MNTQASAVPAVFQYHNTALRVFRDDNSEPLWVLKDICEVLGLANSRMVTDRLDEDEVQQIYVIDSLGREQKTTVVNESGLYTAILRSDKPEARAFKRWITHDLLPNLRKNGQIMAASAIAAIRRETALSFIEFQHALGGRRDMAFAERLIRYRKKGLHQWEVGKLLDIHKDTVRRMEKMIRDAGLWEVLG